MAGRVSTDPRVIDQKLVDCRTRCRVSVDRGSTDVSIDYRLMIFRDVDRGSINNRPRMLQLHMIPLLYMYNGRATFLQHHYHHTKSVRYTLPTVGVSNRTGVVPGSL